MRQVIKGLVRFSILFFGFVFCVYLVLFVVNWEDQPKSATVIEFESFLQLDSGIEDRENGFIYAMGLTASDGESIFEVGQKRIRKINGITTYYPYVYFENNPGFKTLKTDHDKILSECTPHPILDVNCHLSLQNKSELIDQLVLRSQPFLERYEQIIERPYWQETLVLNQFNIGYPLNTYLFISQELLMMRAWAHAKNGEENKAKEMLSRDILFWRNMLYSTQSLLYKSLARAGIRIHFRRANLVLANVSRDKLAKSLPDIWQLPLTDTMYSFRKVMIGEWVLAKNTFALIGNTVFDGPVWHLYLAKFLQPFYKPQDTVNLHTQAVKMAIEAHEGGESISTGVAYCRQQASLAKLIWLIYNPVGRAVVCSATPHLDHYTAGNGNEEGVRRAILLAQRLRVMAVPNEELQSIVEESELRNPRDNNPFVWEPQTRTLIVEGLQGSITRIQVF